MYTLNTTLNTVTRDSDGKVVAPAQSADEPDYLAYVAWVEAGNTPVLTAFVLTQQEPKIKVGAFRERLGPEVKVKVELASIHNPSAPMAQQLLSAKLRVYKEDLINYTHVDLSRADVKAGLAELKAAGLLTQADIDRVYALPFKEDELYHG